MLRISFGEVEHEGKLSSDIRMPVAGVCQLVSEEKERPRDAMVNVAVEQSAKMKRAPVWVRRDDSERKVVMINK